MSRGRNEKNKKNSKVFDFGVLKLYQNIKLSTERN